MPWSQTSTMNQKMQFIADYLRHMLSVTELCELYHISRKTAYKWIDRYSNNGPAGLEDQPRRPLKSPNTTPEHVVSAIIEARQHHPSWGPKKLLKILGRRYPECSFPARSTVCDILKRNGLIPKKRRHRRLGHPGKPTVEFNAPNDVWCADYKGQFKTRDGIYCYPLTITDGCSRFLLGCQALCSTAVYEAKPIFTRVFKEFGLPNYILTDNGVPFATNSLGRLSHLSTWWIHLGILPLLIEPGKPQQNGRHERMHRTLKAETTRPPAANRRTQQRKFNSFLKEFNFVRPHEALELETPASVYTASLREMPSNLPDLEYPSHFEVRLVSANGGIRWKNQWVNVATTCIGEYIGLKEIDNGVWHVYFGPIRIGRLLEEHMRIEDEYGRLSRRKL